MLTAFDEKITGPDLGKAMVNAFVEWVNTSTKYKKLFTADLSNDTGRIIKDALMEIQIYRPYFWNVWWLKNHMRYKGLAVTQVDRRKLDTLMYEFLSLYSRGKLNEKKGSTKRSSRRKAKPSI